MKTAEEILQFVGERARKNKGLLENYRPDAEMSIVEYCRGSLREDIEILNFIREME